MLNNCFIQNCKFEAQYICVCLSCQTYCCEFHLEVHLSLPYRSHTFDSIFDEPCEWTKNEILRFLENEKTKKEKLKKIIKTSFVKYIYEETRLDSDLEQINVLIEKVSQVSEQNQLSNPWNLQHNSPKIMIQEDSELYNSVKLFCKLKQLRLKKYQMLNKVKNDEETEQEFRKTCSFYQNYESEPLLSQAIQEYINDYKKISSLYLLDRTNLLIYDTENESEETKSLKLPDQLCSYVTITPLPNCELFYYGDINESSISFIIDKDYKFKQLPYRNKCKNNSSIYFNRSIYCFGGYDNKWYSCVSWRFDLDEYRWIKLARMPCSYINMSCIIFNNYIFVYTFGDRIFLYSVEIDSFSEIFYIDDDSIQRTKFLISSKERLYVIEFDEDCSIFESDTENLFVLKIVGKSIIQHNCHQIYWSYNKGGIYISCLINNDFRQYYKFDLSRKTLIEISSHIENNALRKSKGKLEAINSYGQTFQLNPDHASNFMNKRFSLYLIIKTLWSIEWLDEEIEMNPENAESYKEKAHFLGELDRNLEALACYNKLIELEPNNWMVYKGKGDTLHEMARNFEAIELYNQAIALSPDLIEIYIAKGRALRDLNRYHEAIECYDLAIKIESKNSRTYYAKGEALYSLGKIAEALECYNQAINFDDEYSKYFMAKAKALSDLDRKLEAIECYNEIDNLSDSFMHCFYRAIAFNDVGREEEALQDLNRAFYLISTSGSSVKVRKNSWYNFIDEAAYEYIIDLMKMICKLEESMIEFKAEIKKLKDATNGEILKEVEEKETLVKEMNSKILKKVVECLDAKKMCQLKQFSKWKRKLLNINKQQLICVPIFGHCSLLTNKENS